MRSRANWYAFACSMTCIRVLNSVSGNIDGEISPINKSVSSLLSCTLLGPVTRFRLTSESRYVNGHWVVSGPLYIGLGQFWIFDFPKKKRKKIEKTEKTGKKWSAYRPCQLPGAHQKPFLTVTPRPSTVQQSVLSGCPPPDLGSRFSVSGNLTPYKDICRLCFPFSPRLWLSLPVSARAS